MEVGRAGINGQVVQRRVGLESSPEIEAVQTQLQLMEDQSVWDLVKTHKIVSSHNVQVCANATLLFNLRV